MSGCEGRCGIELDEAMRELVYRGQVPDDDAPTHTPQRCRRIRGFYDALIAACPGWRVVVYPAVGTRLLTTIVERQAGDRRLAYAQVVHMDPYWAPLVRDEPAWHAEKMRREIAHLAEEPA